MERQQLQEYIEQLNAYMLDMEVTEQERKALLLLVRNIESQLDPTVQSPHQDTLSEQVDELATAFEAEHPTLTAVLNNIMVTLTSIGV